MSTQDKHDQLRSCVERFLEDPLSVGEEIGSLGKRHGYGFIRNTLTVLDNRCKGPSTARDVLSMLRQPEWLWVRTSDPNRLFFGLQTADAFQALGFYYIGQMENGDLHLFQEDVFLDDFRSEQDPRCTRLNKLIALWRDIIPSKNREKPVVELPCNTIAALHAHN